MLKMRLWSSLNSCKNMFTTRLENIISTFGNVSKSPEFFLKNKVFLLKKFNKNR